MGLQIKTAGKMKVANMVLAIGLSKTDLHGKTFFIFIFQAFSPPVWQHVCMLWKS